jgi:hypothetical protein
MSTGFLVNLQAQQQWIKKLCVLALATRHSVHQNSYLVIMRCCYQNNRTASRDVECTAWPYFTEENVDYEFPENDGGIISQMRCVKQRCHGDNLSVQSKTIRRIRGGGTSYALPMTSQTPNPKLSAEFSLIQRCIWKTFSIKI